MRPVRLGLGVAALGLAAVGGAAGYAAERYLVGRLRSEDDPEADEPFGRLPGLHRTVPADDGVPLHVEEVGDPDAPLTVVLCHGYVFESAAWHYQRRDLADWLSMPARVVVYDQRAHGRSGRATPESCTIDQLGRDLATVLAAVAPTGAVALGGHSMGGMTIMALADQRPELFNGERVIAVALVSSSAGRLAEVTFGLPAAIGGLKNRTLPWLARGVRQHPRLVDRTRQVSSDLAFLLTRRIGFGTDPVPPSLVAFVERMVAQTPSEVVAAFYETFTNHDKLAALPVLDGVETLILAGDADLVTPADHARAIAESVPAARLVVVQGAGHNVMIERHEVVTREMAELVERGWARREARRASRGAVPDGRGVGTAWAAADG